MDCDVLMLAAVLRELCQQVWQDPVVGGVLAQVRKSFRRASEGSVIERERSKVGAAWG